MNNTFSLLEKLSREHKLCESEYKALLDGFGKEAAEYAASLAIKARETFYGKDVFVRGLIEISSICKNDCLYCGLRKSNHECERYRLTPDEIFKCTVYGYELGFRTFVLQGGEDAYFTDDVVCKLIKRIKEAHPDVAVTLSLGERSYDSYKRLYDAGADRYLLRHESADSEHYSLLHPESLTFENRKKCLYDLKSIGYQVGCGFMVGSPYQTSKHLAKDLKFIEEFSPDMCGIGPFLPHDKTPFANFGAGDAWFTCYLLSIIRLIKPNILLPATTALGTAVNDGRERGILAGANVIMPNLSPVSVRRKYMLYNGKISSGEESADGIEGLKKHIHLIGYEIVTDRGDIKKSEKKE